jgi:hypothetical protein
LNWAMRGAGPGAPKSKVDKLTQPMCNQRTCLQKPETPGAFGFRHANQAR